MADHVAVGVVDHDHVVTLVFDRIDDTVSHFRRTHFRLQVVGGDFRRRDQNALFAWERFFTATGKEESDVCVFFGFGDA